MTEFVNAYKNLIYQLFPSSGGSSDVFAFLTSGLILLTLAWFFYSFCFFVVRGYKAKEKGGK